MTQGTKYKILDEYPLYKIGSDGSVWKEDYQMKPFKNIMKHRPNCQPYFRIGLIDKNGKRQKIMVHRLVGLAFILNPENKPFINHKNGDKFDNRLENLEWVTNQENCIHASKKGLFPTKLSNKEVRKIRNGDYNHLTQKEIAERLKISPRLIRFIKNGERRQYV